LSFAEFVPSVAGGKRVSEGETLKTAQTWVLGTWRGFKSAMPTFDGGIQIDTAIPGTETKLLSIIMYRNRPFVSPLLKRPLSSNGSESEVSLEKKARLNVAKPLQNPIPDEPQF
jgi:hypothetical protein